MKRHNKHQLYPKSGAASFQQASGCCGAELLLRTPIINLGEGGVGGTFPPSFPFVPLLSPSPPLSLLFAKSRRESRQRQRRLCPGGWRGGRAGRGGEAGRGQPAEVRGCAGAPAVPRCPSVRSRP